MGHVTESIWSNNRFVIPMTEVSHLEKVQRIGLTGGVTIVFKHSRWVNDTNGYEPSAYLVGEEGEAFTKSWCQYRHELEKDTLKPQP